MRQPGAPIPEARPQERPAGFTEAGCTSRQRRRLAGQWWRTGFDDRRHRECGVRRGPGAQIVEGQTALAEERDEREDRGGEALDAEEEVLQRCWIGEELGELFAGEGGEQCEDVLIQFLVGEVPRVEEDETQAAELGGAQPAEAVGGSALEAPAPGQLECAAEGDADADRGDEPFARAQRDRGGRRGHNDQRDRIEQGDVLHALEAAFGRCGGHGGSIAS